MIRNGEPSFDTSMRGYDRKQVDEYVERLESELAEARIGRDAALTTSADRAAQLASAQAHIESLKQSAARGPSLTSGNVSDRIRDMLALASEEAAQTRRAAEMEAERVLGEARADAERLRAESAAEVQRLTAAASQRSAEADQKLAHARNHAAAEIAAAAAEIAGLRAAADSERAQLDDAARSARDAADKESAERRRQADDDFAITLRSRRSAAEREHGIDEAAARERASSIVQAARAEVHRLATERDAIYQELGGLVERLSAAAAGHLQA